MRIRDLVTGLAVAVLGFVGGVAATVYGIFKIAGKTDVLRDVTLPKIKETIADTATAFINRAVFGSDRLAKRAVKPSVYTSYACYKKQEERNKIEYPKIVELVDGGFEVILDSQQKAEELYAWVFHELNSYGYLSVKELYGHVLPNSSAGNLYGEYVVWHDSCSDDIYVEGKTLRLPTPVYMPA